ncbi:MAG: DNA mismatch repair endonuclease MutL [Deltaproteobacteria bacterium]|jgi:DNA mismatch repair protein MutL|nr:DNA mismatch repair endonuclease MutL [Deltaproteobacteria bacterium]
MSSRIHILPDTVANQIAAGEVVERPASVVKELLENALDAGASEIFVDVEKGGRSLVRVSDNGCGMTPDDAFMSLERHATSKIRSSQDLFALQSMGFRGEALPAIASVARLRLTTRSQDDEMGWQIYAEGGTIRHADPVGAAVGTIIEVRDLFFNTPGRRKFLRREETEFGHISDVLMRIALARPDIHIRLNHNNRTCLEAYRHKDLHERAAALLGRALVADLLPVDIDAERDLGLTGLLSPPGVNRSTTHHLYTYVNNRFVRDRVLQHAILDAYRSLIEKRRYPIGVLFLELPPDQVDVNVHPTKHEVRFRDQGLVHDFVTSAIRRLLQNVNPILEREESRAPSIDGTLTVSTGAGLTPRETSVRLPDQDGSYHAQLTKARVEQALQNHASTALAGSRSVHVPTVKGKGFELPPRSYGESTLPDGWRLIGQYLNSYLVCQAGEDLVVIDQHAAHERIGFERLRQQLKSGQIASQSLLFPTVMEFDHRETVTINETLDEFERFGFEIEPFAGRSFSVKAIPEILSDHDVERLIRDVVAELNDIGRSKQLDTAIDRVLMVLACHGMVRAGQALSVQEMEALVNEIAAIDFGSCCPHGRPVLRRLKRNEVEKFFHRI